MNKTLADLSKQELRRNTATSEGDNSEAVSPDARRTKAGANVRDRQEIIFKKGKVIKLGGDGTNLFVGDEVAPILPLIDTDDEKSSDDESASFSFLQRVNDRTHATLTAFYSPKQKRGDEPSQGSNEAAHDLLSKCQTRSRSRHVSRKSDLAQRKHKGPCAKGCDCTTSRDLPLRRELKMLQQYAGQDPMEKGKTPLPWFSALVLWP